MYKLEKYKHKLMLVNGGGGWLVSKLTNPYLDDLEQKRVYKQEYLRLKRGGAGNENESSDSDNYACWELNSDGDSDSDCDEHWIISCSDDGVCLKLDDSECLKIKNIKKGKFQHKTRVEVLASILTEGLRGIGTIRWIPIDRDVTGVTFDTKQCMGEKFQKEELQDKIRIDQCNRITQYTPKTSHIISKCNNEGVFRSCLFLDILDEEWKFQSTPGEYELLLEIHIPEVEIEKFQVHPLDKPSVITPYSIPAKYITKIRTDGNYYKPIRKILNETTSVTFEENENENEYTFTLNHTTSVTTNSTTQ